MLPTATEAITAAFAEKGACPLVYRRVPASPLIGVAWCTDAEWGVATVDETTCTAVFEPARPRRGSLTRGAVVAALDAHLSTLTA